MMKIKKFLMVTAIALSSAIICADNVFEVKHDRGVPRLFLNGKVIPSRIFFGSFKHAGFPHSKTVVPREFKYAHEVAGVDIFEGHGDLLWSDGDLEKLKAQNKAAADRFFSAHPEGFMLVRLGTVPPLWWYDKHPEVRTVFNTGLHSRSPYVILPALSSEVYQRETVDALRRTVQFYEETYPGRIAGYHIAGMHTSEWLYDTSYLRESEGYDPCSRIGFRNYLKEKYKTDTALQKAWHDNSVTFATVEVPTHEERIGNGQNFLREPATDQKLLDFYNFWTKLISSSICRFAKVVKETQPGRLVGVFYGYCSLATWYGGGGKSGYLSLREVLDSPDVDFFCSPLNYNGRRRDQGVTTQGVLGSIAEAGKLWLNEDDTATYLGYVTHDGGPSMMSACRTPQETADMLRRNLVFTLINNHAIWWMDLNGAGWFDDPDIWLTMKELIPFETALIEHPQAYTPEIAIALDHPGAMHFIGEHSKEGAPPNFATDHINNLAYIGAPLGIYLQDDVLNARVKPKLTLFLSCYALNAKQRAAMREYAGSNGCVWLWAPGYIDLESGRISLDAVRETTGFTVRECKAEATLAVNATPEGRKLGMTGKIGPSLRFGVPSVVLAKPNLTPVLEKGDSVLGVYEKTGEPAIVLRMVNGKPHVFCGTSVIQPELFRHVAELAGVHFYTEPGPALFSNGREIAVYAPRDIDVTITPRQPGNYTEYFSGRKYNGSKIRTSLKTGETFLLSPLGATVNSAK